MKLRDASELSMNLAGLLDSKDPEPENLDEIAEVLLEFQEILIAESRPVDAEVAISAQELANRLCKGGVEDVPAALAWLGQVNMAFGRILSEGASPEEAGYPEAFPEAAVQDETDDLDLEISDMNIDEAIFAEFYQRQGENLQTFENDLMALESGHRQGDQNAWMRLFHTIKGEAGLLGLTDISELSHNVEDLLLNTDPGECIIRLMNVKDWLQKKFEMRNGQGEELQSVEDMITMLGNADTEKCETSALKTEAEGANDAESDSDPEYYDLNAMDGDVELIQEFIGEATEHLDNSEASLLILESDATNQDALDAVFRAFHTIKGVAGFIDMSHIQEFAHKAENLLDAVRKGEIDLKGPALDITFEAVDMLKTLISDLVEAFRIDGCIVRRPEYTGLLERLINYATGNFSSADPISESPTVPETVQKPDVAVSESEAADPNEAPKGGVVLLSKRKKPAAGTKKSPPVPKGGGVQMREALRVDANRLDLLVETIGELVIAEAMISQNPTIRASESVRLLKDIDHLDKICRELQELGMSLRMVPVRPTFQKMARLVRDLSKKSGRKIKFVTDGEDTELDKSVVEKIGDPLVHMLRNAVDHGIEANVEERIAAGKTPEGNIELRAYHKGGNICIEVRDDGKGLDRDVILAKGIERGLVSDGVTPSDRDIFNLIFEPGFSTAKEVTDVSGRGVGMDVVRRNIEELRGSVDIWSVKGEGSVFSFRLPLTMAIIDGMVVRCGQENYIIPTLSVVRLVRPTRKEYSTVLNRGEMLRFEDELIPMFRLNRLFGVPDARDNYEQAVIVMVESEGRRVGLMTDDLLGQQQTVIKSLGESVQGTAGIAGGAIMSNGKVALILDVAGLVKVAYSTNSSNRELQ